MSFRQSERPALEQMDDGPQFDVIKYTEFKEIFLNVITLGSKDNTYKFALARFLIDYSRENDATHVSFSTIAQYFLRYYWPQICKLKMKHAPQVRKKPVIVKIIEKQFPEGYYPQTFKEILKDPKYKEQVRTCIEEIKKECFHNVIWRFQRIKVNKATESRLFFEYKIARVVHHNRKYVDLDHGINLNPEAMEFFKRHDAFLLKSVILEWAKFLEKLNIGLPKIVAKTEGLNARRTSLTKYRKSLEPICTNCFYCGEELQKGRETHVEHVIPFDYIAEDDIWNLTLACQKCNLYKLGALPPKKYIDKLVERNAAYRKKIQGLDDSLSRLDSDFKKVIMTHYNGAKSQGYRAMKQFECVASQEM